MRQLLPFALVVSSLIAQDPVRDDPAVAVFHHAFFVDRGLEERERALGLYLEFLEQAPRHREAGRAARLAIDILRELERENEAKALAEKHAAVIAEFVPVGINVRFLDPGADVSQLVNRFEAESREIFKNRHEILALVGLQKGQAVADIGAGTGFFTNLFAREVGPEGKAYAVEIGPAIVEHLRKVRDELGLPQIEVVQCTARSAELPANSVDVVFICDTYHHFEHQAATLASLHRALREGGQLILIDFERIPGVSSEFTMGHVRAGKEVFRAEVEAAGFEFVREEPAEFLAENYMLRFAKK